MNQTAINFDASSLRVLPKQLQGASCSKCDKPQAVWELTRADLGEGFICSLCMLYETRWGEENAAHLLAFIGAVVENTGEPILMDHGRIVKPDDANRIFGALVAENKVTSLRQRLWRMRDA